MRVVCIRQFSRDTTVPKKRQAVILFCASKVLLRMLCCLCLHVRYHNHQQVLRVPQYHVQFGDSKASEVLEAKVAAGMVRCFSASRWVQQGENNCSGENSLAATVYALPFPCTVGDAASASNTDVAAFELCATFLQQNVLEGKVGTFAATISSCNQRYVVSNPDQSCAADGGITIHIMIVRAFSEARFR